MTERPYFKFKIWQIVPKTRELLLDCKLGDENLFTYLVLVHAPLGDQNNGETAVAKAINSS